MITGISGKIGSGKDTFARLLQYWSNPEIYGEIKLRHYLQKCETCDNLSPIQIKKFAANVKVITALLIGCTVQDLENEEFKNKILGPEWDKFAVGNSGSIYYGAGYFTTVRQAEEYLDDHGYVEFEVIKIQMTPRLLMQLIGNDFGRDMVHPNLWVTTLMNEYQPTWNKYNNPVPVESLQNPLWIITDNRYLNEIKAIEQRQGLTIRIERKINLIYPEFWKEYKKMPYYNETDYGFHQWLKVHSEETSKLYKKLTHASETSLDDYQNFEVVIHNNGLIEELSEEAKHVVLSYPSYFKF